MNTNSPLLRFLFVHCVIGGAVGLGVGAALLFFDVGGLGTLSRKVEPFWLAPFLLCFSFFASFGALAMGAAVMSLGPDTDENGKTKHQPTEPAEISLQPVPVTERQRRR